MDYARAQNCVVLTRDLDFSTILAITRARGPSLIRLRVDKANPQLIGKQVIDVIHKMAAELEEGALVTINLKRTRLRVLPLR